jgi:nucleotide-binding universal stress UspA family protein
VQQHARNETRVIDRETVTAILQKRFPGARPRELAAAVNAIVGLGTWRAQEGEGAMIALKNILVATDFSEAAATALAYGRELARRYDATLHVLHVVDDVGARLAAASTLPYDTSRMQENLNGIERRRLDEALTDEDRRELRLKIVQLVSGSPSHEIVDYAVKAGVDLLIVGTHGRGPIAHTFLGSVAERVVRHAPCPVLTIKHPEREFLRPDALQRVSTA